MQGIHKSDTGLPRIAIITAYYKEPEDQLRRCLDSVRSQTVKADHIFVADGFPQDWIETTGVRHVKLDRSHGDYGNTPRGIGSLLAISEDYDAIGFLDADNWLDTNHIEMALKTARQTQGSCDFVIARRSFRRPDGSELPVADEPVDQHIDTNCYLFFAGTYHALLDFAVIPRQLSAIGDRLFYAKLKTHGLRSTVIAAKTVNYHCLWESLYRCAGESPPPDGKPNIDQAPMIAWLNGLSHEKRIHAVRRAGLPTS